MELVSMGDTLNMDYGDKMEYSEALIEWESGGLGDIPTKNLLEFLEVLKKEIEDRA